MSFYDDSIYPVRDDLAAVHASQLKGWGAPGTWGSGAQRLAIAAEARKACIDEGLLEVADGFDSSEDLEIPGFVRDIVARLAVSPKDVDQNFYHTALEKGISDAEYVEIVGLVARITNIDIFARGIGVPLRPLPAAEPGRPSQGRPGVAVMELAWVPTIANPPDGGALAHSLYDGHPMPYIVRALSLVPAELRMHVALEQVQYLPLKHILQYDYQHHEGLSRAQAEIVAGRVSALNECFF